MNKLFILDGQTEGILAVLQNDSSKKCPFFVGIHTEQLNKDHTFELSVPADHEAAAHVKRNNLVLFKDVDGEYQLFQIYKTEEEHDGTQLTTKAYAEHSYFEMVDDIIEDLRTINDTADSAMTDALSKSRFKKGTIADLGLRTTNFYYESAVSSIQKIIQTWGGELKKRISFNGSRITERLIDLPARRGADTGKRFEFTKDLLSIKRTVDISNLKTALYGRGKGEETETGGYTRRITFADVVWNASGLDSVDKPAGQEWVGDPVALERFGRIDPETGQKKHRMGVFEDGEETDPEALLQSTWDYLQSINTPRVTYEMSVLDLEEVAGLSHEKVRLGDTVFVIDKEFTPALRIEARVIELRRDLENPENTQIILGNFLPMFTDLSSRLKSVESKLDEKEGVWDGVQDPIDDTDFADITPAKPIVKATGAFSKVIIEWDADLRSYLKEYEVYVSPVNNFTPDSSNLVARTSASIFTYEGAPNQQYYVKVRGVNRAGTAGPFSDQRTATTARIGSSDLADLLITAEKLAVGSVGNNKIDRSSANKLVIDTADIANAAITSALIEKAAVGSAAIANLAVGTAHIQDLAVNRAKIADLAVDTAKIADLAVTNAKIGNISANKITSDYLNVARIDVRAQLGANISTAEEGLYSYMKPYTVNGQTWYGYSIIRDWIYLIEETEEQYYNRPIPEDGDELVFDFELWAENTSGASPNIVFTINVDFEGGGSYTHNALLHQLMTFKANAVNKVHYAFKIPENAYAGQKAVSWYVRMYTTTDATNLYVRETDVRIRLRGNLIVQGDIEAKNLKAWEGLNVNDQFIVDALGNVKFAGTLEAGVSINSPNINSGQIELVGEYSRIDCYDSLTATQEEAVVSNGLIIQTHYDTAGNNTTYRYSSMSFGHLEAGISDNLEGQTRSTNNYHLLPYEYKLYNGGTRILPGLIDNRDVSGSKILPDTLTRINGSQAEATFAYPMYIYADRLGIGTHKLDGSGKGLLLDIRSAEPSSSGKFDAMISAQDAMHFRLIGDNKNAIEFHNTVKINANSDLLQLYGSDHVYVEFFKNGGTTRSAYYGFGSAGSNGFTLRNEISGGELTLVAGSGGIVNIPSNDLKVRSITYTSDEGLKSEIELYEKSALQEILATPIKQYYLEGDVPGVDQKRLGIIYQEAPIDIVTPQKSLDGYAMDVMSFKAIQELHEEIQSLKTIIEGMNPNEPGEPTEPAN
ncbi:phage tail spike protein [Cytobacillus oceanisediminis]|uniref:phage tail spike protein n=1 Tax=Cytobacillus oceanisediminis TaxID=665099 RepID=UPI00207A1CC4|nr:phage tail spike protein [Cytobacillus oceanisediminis]USK43529.1 phage tail protein [Cytobacillus oceanisediminis]